MSDDALSVRVRGVYTTALTHRLLDADHDVVQASPPIQRRFDESFDAAAADVTVATTDDRQGVGVEGRVGVPPEAVDRAADVCDVARDVLSWRDPTPTGTVVDGEVAETLGSGAVVSLGEREGFLPFDAVDGYVDEGDRLRVQVREARPPWDDDRPTLATDVQVGGDVVTLTRGASGVRAEPRGERGTELVRTTDLLSADAPDGWGVRWGYDAADADMSALDDALAAASEAAGVMEASLADAPTPDAGDDHPRTVATPTAGRWFWFGREARFALDDDRRAVTTTMPGHHRLKAAHRAASTAVDFAESVVGSGFDENADDAFPFAAAAENFGPVEGDRVAIGHGKPDGRYFVLGRGEVTGADLDAGQMTVERTMSGRGTYDALGTERERGDVAVTKLKEGRWWYPTVYRGEDGTSKGTYVNVCTPVELFPDVARYVDLHVDVVKYPDGTVERVDDDELDDAVAAGDVPEELAEKARTVAAAVERALS